MYKNLPYWLLPVFLVFVLSGCAQTEASGPQMDYEETKKMVVDILKTDDGKKAVEEIMADSSVKEQLIMDNAVVSDTIQKTLTSNKGTEFWKKSFEDPKFAESMAKGMQSEHEKLIKDLMNDPAYRGMLIEVLKDPELEKEFADLMESKRYREHMQTVITETFESPIFKAKLQDLMVKAAGEIQAGEEAKEKE
ncbi:spore germination lipoprotein GerD [Mesobacillus harenae]|uniref:spore germination lipoprotein GerD n=1 Tax=Mesobacillus harenae TaxID=2213203 RepID=UPI001580E677|nr:spore germination lipoprotein GerD [Mesobacillus harenae]